MFSCENARGSPDATVQETLFAISALLVLESVRKVDPHPVLVRADLGIHDGLDAALAHAAEAQTGAAGLAVHLELDRC